MNQPTPSPLSGGELGSATPDEAPLPGGEGVGSWVLSRSITCFPELGLAVAAGGLGKTQFAVQTQYFIGQ